MTARQYYDLPDGERAFWWQAFVHDCFWRVVFAAQQAGRGS